VCLLCGCVSERGFDRVRTPAGPTSGAGVSLILLGDAGAPTPHADRVAERLEGELARARAAGRTPIVLWLGNAAHTGKRRTPCPTGSGAGPGSPRLHATIAAHLAADGSSYLVAGPAEWRCGLVGDALDDPSTPFSWPAPQYVVAVGESGDTAVRWTCTEAGCREHPQDTPPRIELVMVDATPWTAKIPEGDPTLRALDRLLETLAADPDRPPRILVSHFPVEAAGEHGLGGYDADATIHTLYPPLRDAVLAGQFDGVVAAHDRATYAHRDLTDAIKRGDRAWLRAPLWQVVAGAASMPDAASARLAPKTRYFTGSTYVPDAFSPNPGFAVVHLRGDEMTATLHARGRTWRSATIRAPLRGAPHPAATASPPMAPCLRCPSIPASERP
jgi:hypothetical protein